ncbi:MAG: universal stress protein, partial [Actinomycetota bacterium]
MAVVVGYVPTKEGRAALRRASEECLLRRTKLIVINSSRGGKDFDATEARRFEAELSGIQTMLDEAGVEHEVRQLVRGK